MRRRLAAASAAAVLLAGCSSGGSAGSSRANASLQGDVLALTQAAAAHDWTAADAAMNNLRSDLAAAVAAGRISPSRAAAIRTHLAAVAADVTARTTTPTPTRTPAPAKTPVAPKPKPGPRPTKHDKHGHGGGGDQGGDGGD